MVSNRISDLYMVHVKIKNVKKWIVTRLNNGSIKGCYISHLKLWASFWLMEITSRSLLPVTRLHSPSSALSLSVYDIFLLSFPLISVPVQKY